jgi:hypothetical protein
MGKGRKKEPAGSNFTMEWDVVDETLERRGFDGTPPHKKGKV